MKLALAAFVSALALAGPALAQDPAPAPEAPPVARTPNDYRQDAAWLCRPGRSDACAQDQTTTIVAGNGALTTEAFKANGRAPIDCFYVYPTVSMDQAGNSDMTAGPEERSVIQQQFARFGSQCRTFAPLYRQVTTTSLRYALGGQTLIGTDRELPYADVKAAWADYLRRDNKKRGVVLIGHSQGAGVLKRLIAEEIEGKPIQSQIVSAMLIGTNVLVPEGRDVGGDLKSMPLCRSVFNTGCVVSYVSFRWEAPPPPAARFGRTATPGQQVACTNPAALTGGLSPLRAYLPARASAAVAAESGTAMTAWTTPEQAIATPFVAVPRLLTGECVKGENGSYFAVITYADPADPRTDRIPGDLIIDGNVQTDWGLHLIDMHLAMGDLVELVGKQATAYREKTRKRR